MGWEAFLQMILKKSLTLLAWPPFSLLFPLYASIRAMESDSRSSKQRCLAFWVLFSLFKIVESGFAELFNWLLWWPHLKGFATILLVLPCFGGASYVYNYYIKCYFTENRSTRMWNIFFSQSSTCLILDEHSKLDEASDRTIIKNEIKEKKVVVYLGRYDPDLDPTESNYAAATCVKKVEKEWSCALCQISTTSESCLASHLQGKKHKAKEKELRVESPMSLSSKQKRTNGMVPLENHNQIANLLGPVSRSIKFCGWVKPGTGWTKLNTDGSRQRENAGLGGLLRDFRGEAICAFVSKVPRVDVFLVELWAIWRGLVLASGLGIKVIWVESDSMRAVETINKKQASGPKAAQYLEHIWKLLSKFEKYHVTHSWRETNRAADHLAKMILRGNDVVLWPGDFPDSLCHIIRDDAEGKKYPRLGCGGDKKGRVT